MVGLIFGILRYVKKKKNSYKQTETKWQKRGKMKTKKKKQKKKTNSVLGSLLNDCSQSDKFS